MLTVFETRDMGKFDLQRISDWRNGIAIARYYNSSIKPSWHYFLIDANYSYIFSNQCYEEDELEGEQIERIWGGYYVVRDVKSDGCITYPGKDRDTIYFYKTYIKDVIDENGKVLTDNDRKEFLKSNPIRKVTEYGNGLIQSGSSFYGLDNYQYLFDLQKEIEPLGVVEKEKCKVKVISDYRDFIVLVKDKRIKHVFKEDDFILISKLLKRNLDNWKWKSVKSYTKPYYFSVDKPHNITSFKTVKPEINIRIYEYDIGVSTYCIDCVGEGLYYDENYGFNRLKLKPCTSYFYVNNEWIKIDEADSIPIFDEIFKKKCNRPNFIKEIEMIATDIMVDGELFDIYKFECRPYGYLTKNGILEYEFDVNNINW